MTIRPQKSDTQAVMVCNQSLLPGQSEHQRIANVVLVRLPWHEMVAEVLKLLSPSLPQKLAEQRARQLAAETGLRLVGV